MIVQSSSVHLSAEHEKYESSEVHQSLLQGDRASFAAQFQQVRMEALQFSQSWFGAAPITGAPEENKASILVMTDEGLKFRSAQERESDMHKQQELTRARLLQSLLDAINPKSRDFFTQSQIDIPDVETEGVEYADADMPLIRLPAITMEMTFKMTESIEEYECTTFNSCGIVKTADGQEIEFDLGLKMERSYSASREYEMTQEVVFTDPLIVNFEGNAADLSEDKYAFDIDADGETEMISYLLGSSGMLALDKNGDGVINDGSELFGALTGDGFAELAAYDEDGNNFIDEADSIFSELGIWTKTAEDEQIQSLQERGIGAIYLGASDTPFDIKDEKNQQHGRVISSGFYLTEAGDVGTVQQIDMVV